jgi:hypothetical protein
VAGILNLVEVAKEVYREKKLGKLNYEKLVIMPN